MTTVTKGLTQVTYCLRFDDSMKAYIVSRRPQYSFSLRSKAKLSYEAYVDNISGDTEFGEYPTIPIGLPSKRPSKWIISLIFQFSPVLSGLFH